MRRRKLSEHKIGVIGTINRDTIYRADGKVIGSWGGILYNIKYLCDSRTAVIIPAVNVGGDCFKSIIEILKRQKNIDLSYVRRVGESNNHCVLRYRDQSAKNEVLKGGVPPLTFSRVKPLLETEAVLVNFISGRDIQLAALERLRSEYAGLIYMDIHSLTLGRKKTRGGFRRFLRRPRHWKRYISCADITQVNRMEFELLAECGLSRQAAADFFSRQLHWAKGLIITLGAEGCLVVYRKNRIICRHVPAPKAGRVADTTGCGDVFAAGFLSEYLISRSFIRAAANGNCLAAERCRKKGKMF